MAETIFQKRIYELEEYIQLTSLEPGYEDPATIWLGVDRLSWAEAKRMSLVDFVANLHKEQGPVDLSGLIPGNLVEVIETYDTEFSTSNYYLKIQPYRVVSVPGYGSVIEPIPIVDLVKTTTGFTFKLTDYQVGDTVNYLAFE